MNSSSEGECSFSPVKSVYVSLEIREGMRANSHLLDIIWSGQPQASLYESWLWGWKGPLWLLRLTSCVDQDTGFLLLVCRKQHIKFLTKSHVFASSCSELVPSKLESVCRCISSFPLMPQWEVIMWHGLQLLFFWWGWWVGRVPGEEMDLGSALTRPVRGVGSCSLNPAKAGEVLSALTRELLGYNKECFYQWPLLL